MSTNKVLAALAGVIVAVFVTKTAQASLQNAVVNCGPAASKVGRFTVQAGTAGDPCHAMESREPYLLYVHLHRAMYICENGVTTWANFVSGGKKGFKKQRQGDKKVPEGIYKLGTPRPSQRFGLFIPIAYPNAEDMAVGRTGGSVGIHGPLRTFACDASSNLFTPWTDGCIAYPSDRHILELSRWVMANPNAYIVLREK